MPGAGGCVDGVSCNCGIKLERSGAVAFQTGRKVGQRRAAQEGFVSACIFGAADILLAIYAAADFLIPRDLRDQFERNSACNFGLDGKDIGELAIIGVALAHHAITDPVKLGADADCIEISLNTATQD
ncbi:MAG: hypothetical protein HRT64_05350 [Erythrobacter sp.]|nr:hypothetical protein [Erythrobacter sp.]